MTAPAPFLPKPSILDRVLGRLFPTDQYGGLLDPNQQQDIRRQGLIGLGTGILAQGGPGSGPLQAFGKAYQGLDLSGIADHALKLQAYRKQLAQEAALEAAKAGVHRQPGETDYDYIAHLAGATAGLPGSEKLSSLADALKPSARAVERPRWSFQTIMEHGEPVLYRINEDTGDKYRVGLAKPAAGENKQPSLTERKAASEGFAAASADTELRTIENGNPATLAEVARFVATPSIGRLVPWSGAGIEAVLRQARTAGLSDAAQTYIKRLYDFASLAGPSRYGRNFRSEVLLQQIWSDFGAGQLGVSGGGITATQKNRENAVAILRGTGGERARKVVAPLFAPPVSPKGTRKTYSPDNPFAPAEVPEE